jgi:hypothetical protein
MSISPLVSFRFAPAAAAMKPAIGKLMSDRIDERLSA